MEAWRFGFDPSSLPSTYKFDPTDADIVAHYLLPRAAGVPDPPNAHAVIDDDTCSCPPWELFARHGHAGSDHAFFAGPPSDPAVNGGRARRRVHGGAGVWRGQRGEDSDLVVVRASGGAELRIKFRRYNLTYYRRGETESTGWVMHEYHILQPRLRPGAVLSRIRITGKAKKERDKQQRQAAAAAEKDQPGPSNYDLVNDHAAGDAAVVASDGEGDVAGRGDDGNGGGVVGETAGGYYTNLLNAGVEEDDGYYADGSSSSYFAPERPGPSSSRLIYDSAAGKGVALNDGGAGTSGAQADAVHQDGSFFTGEDK